MTNVSEWSTTAGSNNSAPPDGWPENMLPGKVNDCAREMMGALAKWYQDQTASLTTAGSTTAYTLTTNAGYTALSDVPLLAFRVHAANTGAVTLNVDGLGAKSVVKIGGTALSSGDLVITQVVCVAYNASLDRFDLIGPQVGVAGITAAQVLALLITVDGSGSGLDADLLDGSSSAAYATAAALATTNANLATDAANLVTTNSNLTTTNTNVTNLTSSLATTNANLAALIPTTTPMLFGQTAAPTGWTKLLTHDNKALRLVTGTASSGGSTAFTSVFTSRTVALANLPVTNLSLASLTASLDSSSISNGSNVVRTLTNDDFGTFAASAGGNNVFDDCDSIDMSTLSISNTDVSIGGTLPLGGSGTAMDFAVQYVDVIMATKN